MSKALQIYDNFDNLERAATALYKSGYFQDARNEAQAIVKVMAGSELGLPAFASMAGIHIIQGKPVLGSNVMATLVKNDPRYNFHIKQADNEACILTWFENGKEVGEAGFTIQEAKNAGLTNKDNWKKWTSDMLFARAIRRGARRFAPGIFGGSPVYTPDEMGVDTDEEGYIEAKIVSVDKITAENITDPEPEEDQTMTIEDAFQIVNRDGVSYGEIPSDKLKLMNNSINTALKKNGLTEEEKQTYLTKMKAIGIIIQAREDGSI